MKKGILSKYAENVSNESLVSDVVFDSSQNKFFTEGSPQAAEQTEETEALPIEQTPTDNLFDAMNTISTEAGFIGNVSNYFQRKVSNFGIHVRDGFKHLTTWNYDPMLTLNPLSMTGFVTTLDYFEVEKETCPQPAGFKGEILPYTDGLVVRARIMAQIVEKVIKPAAARFGHYITTPIDRAERRTFEYGIDIDQSIDQLVKDDAAYFAANRQVTASFGKLYSSLNDFVLAERNMVEVNTILKGGETSTVKTAVAALSQTATALMERIAKDSEIKTSSEFAKMMADELTEVAKWVEWYAIQMTRIIETNNVLAATEKQLRDL